METVFKSKVDKTLMLPILIIALVHSAVIVMADAAFVLLFTIPLFTLIASSLYTIKYVINGQELRIYILTFRYSKIDILKIKTITETNNPLSSPAASLDRLDLRIARWGSVLVSPDDKEKFLQMLLEINPAIEVKRKAKKVG